MNRAMAWSSTSIVLGCGAGRRQRGGQGVDEQQRRRQRPAAAAVAAAVGALAGVWRPGCAASHFSGNAALQCAVGGAERGCSSTGRARREALLLPSNHSSHPITCDRRSQWPAGLLALAGPLRGSPSCWAAGELGTGRISCWYWPRPTGQWLGGPEAATLRLLACHGTTFLPPLAAAGFTSHPSPLLVREKH